MPSRVRVFYVLLLLGGFLFLCVALNAFVSVLRTEEVPPFVNDRAHMMDRASVSYAILLLHLPALVGPFFAPSVIGLAILCGLWVS